MADNLLLLPRNARYSQVIKNTALSFYSGNSAIRNHPPQKEEKFWGMEN